MLGLTWGMCADEVTLRLGLPPLHGSAEEAVFSLDTLVGGLVARAAFCPSLFVDLGDACDGRLHLAFAGRGLIAGELRFRHSFEAIGKSADGLSDMAMAAYVRAELQQLIFEFTARYGPPVHISEHPMRWDNVQPVGTALFRNAQGDTMQVMLGHDGSGVTGWLRYLPPATGEAGF